MAPLGYKVGKPDGVYGDKTLNAVRKFQRKSKLAADGLVGAKTAKAINKALGEGERPGLADRSGGRGQLSVARA